MEYLIRQSTIQQSINDYPDIAWMGFDPEADTTHHLENANAWLNMINPLVTRAGATAIAENVKTNKGYIEALIQVAKFFDGTDEDKWGQAWNYLESIEAYVANDRIQQEQMRRAGY